MKKKIALLMVAVLACGALSACAGGGDSISGASSGASSLSVSETVLADGEYLPDDFTYSGGSGKVKIACDKVMIEDGEAVAEIVFSSEHYTNVSVGSEEYSPQPNDGGSYYLLPVVLNESLTITGTTTAMSEPHDIDYEICVCLAPESAREYSKEAAEALLSDAFADDSSSQDTETASASEPAGSESIPPEISGLEYESSMELEYATGFAVHYYSNGYKLIDVIGDCRYLVVPEGGETPDGLDADTVVLNAPPRNIFMSASSVMALFDALDSIDSIKYSSREQEDWYIESAAAAMEDGDMAYAGKYSSPDYELLLDGGCDLAIESTMILHAPEVKEMLEDIGIPVFVDRSSYEEHPLGRTEWIKVYAAMLDKESGAEAFFGEQAEKLADAGNFESTGKSVAFFYINTEGSVVVRNSDDYIAEMIRMAGGDYIYDEQVGGSESAKVTVSLEEFYDSASEADCLIYNSATGGEIDDIDGLLEKSELFADFKAVKNSCVWTADDLLYQATDRLADFITDVHKILTGSEDGLVFLTKLD